MEAGIAPTARPRQDLAAALAGDESAFAALVDRHRRELHVHCYRMMGSLEDTEDVLQETFLRAWRSRATFRAGAGSSFRAWLYRIATNACLDALATKPRRVTASQLGPPHDPDLPPPPPADLPWLEPYPDRLLEGVAPSDAEPDAVVVRRETIELAFLAAIQLLPPRQRAALILRDVLAWSAKETASLLETTVASVNSALQRARATLEQQRPAREACEVSAEERDVLRRYMAAFERSDAAAVAELLHDDVRSEMPPLPFWIQGRAANVRGIENAFESKESSCYGEWRCVATGANLQPAAAHYLRRPGDDTYRAQSLAVLRIEAGKVIESTSFPPELFAAFGLPPTL
jgi:RNA polymerase sigma-70 factor, ECF subfamily